MDAPETNDNYMKKYIILIHLVLAVILPSCSDYDAFEPTSNELY